MVNLSRAGGWVRIGAELQARDLCRQSRPTAVSVAFCSAEAPVTVQRFMGRGDGLVEKRLKGGARSRAGAWVCRNRNKPAESAEPLPG